MVAYMLHVHAHAHAHVHVHVTCIVAPIIMTRVRRLLYCLVIPNLTVNTATEGELSPM